MFRPHGLSIPFILPPILSGLHLYVFHICYILECVLSTRCFNVKPTITKAVSVEIQYPLLILNAIRLCSHSGAFLYAQNFMQHLDGGVGYIIMHCITEPTSCVLFTWRPCILGSITLTALVVLWDYVATFMIWFLILPYLPELTPKYFSISELLIFNSPNCVAIFLTVLLSSMITICIYPVASINRVFLVSRVISIIAMFSFAIVASVVLDSVRIKVLVNYFYQAGISIFRTLP